MIRYPCRPSPQAGHGRAGDPLVSERESRANPRRLFRNLPEQPVNPLPNCKVRVSGCILDQT